MSIKNYVFNNFGLKVTAMVVAFFVWVMIAGSEKSFIEKTIKVDVVYTNVPENINVLSVRPDKVRFKVQGTAKQWDRISTGDFKVNIDLTGVTENKPLNYFTEDHLEYPSGVKLLSMHPKMVEVTVREFITVEVGIRVRYKGKLPNGVKLLARKLVPNKVKITGYKSQIAGIKTIEAEEVVNLADIQESVNLRIPLRANKDIIRFEGSDMVEVRVTVENTTGKEEGTKKEEPDKLVKPGNKEVEKNKEKNKKTEKRPE